MREEIGGCLRSVSESEWEREREREQLSIIILGTKWTENLKTLWPGPPSTEGNRIIAEIWKTKHTLLEDWGVAFRIGACIYLWCAIASSIRLFRLGPELTASACTLHPPLTFTLIICVSVSTLSPRVSTSNFIALLDSSHFRYTPHLPMSLLPTCSLPHHPITTFGSPFNNLVHFRFFFL